MKPERSALVRGALRLVPDEFVERVLEPVLADLRTAELETGRKTPPTEWLVIVFECLRLLVPRPFWLKGRLTPLGRGLIAIALAIFMVWLLATRATFQYGPKASPLEAARGETKLLRVPPRLSGFAVVGLVEGRVTRPLP